MIKKVTKLLVKNDSMNTEYGFITNQKWCELENRRLGKNHFVDQSGKLVWLSKIVP